MEYVKAHVLATVLATQASALIWGDVPYFPIEISRTAASGKVPLTVFRVGFATIGGTLIATRSLNVQTSLVWTCLSAICMFDDKSNWFIHMAGVYGLIGVSGYSIYLRGSMAVMPFTCAVVIYLVRAAMKMILIDRYEIGSESRRTLRGWIQALHKRHMAINYHGATACARPDLLMPAFKICAVLQWVLLYSLSYCF